MGNQIGRLKDKQAAIQAQANLCFVNISDLKARIKSSGCYKKELMNYNYNLNILRTLIAGLLTDREIDIPPAIGDAVRNLYSSISNCEIILNYDGSDKENFIIMCVQSEDAFKDFCHQNDLARIPDIFGRLEKCLSKMFTFIKGLVDSTSKAIGNIAGAGNKMIE